MGFTVILGLLLVVAGTLFWSLNRLHRNTERLEYAYSQAIQILDIEAKINRQLKEVSDFLTLADEDEIKEFEEHAQAIQTAFDRWQSMTEAEVDFVGDEEEELAVILALRQEYDRMTEGCQEVIQLTKNGQLDQAAVMLEETIETAFDQGFSEHMDDIIQEEELEVVEVKEATLKLHAFIRKVSYAIAFCSIILAGLLAIHMVSSISHPLRQIREAMVRTGGGRLDTKVDLDTNDEFGDLARSFERMTVDLQQSTTSICELHQEIQCRRRAEQRQQELLKQLEVRNKELNDFAHIVSHDLKAPLRAIQTLTGWIKEDSGNTLTPESQEQFDLMLSRVNRMRDLIDGILQYSRVGYGKEESVDIDIASLVNEVIESLEPPDHISVTIVDDMPVLCAGQVRISQVFQNLISNAIKYMDKSHGCINIGCCEQEDSWRFHVTDNGMGIDPKQYDKVFGMFQTLAARDEYESTGVGLTVVKKIVETYGGKIWIESQVGEGSTFFFTLPKQMTSNTIPVEANCVG